jgi:inorganic pyrophosphatase
MRFILLIVIFSSFFFQSFSSEITPDLERISEYQYKSDKDFIRDYETFASSEFINVVIEIPKGTREKWEVSKFDGSLERDFAFGKPRTIEYAPYPSNYGMIPKTVLPKKKGGDGDPLDAIVLGEKKTMGTIIQVKVLGVLYMTDFGENDHKIICIPLNEVSSFNEKDLEIMVKNISDWFLNYKGQGVVEINNFSDEKDALNLVKKANKYYKKWGVKKVFY